MKRTTPIVISVIANPVILWKSEIASMPGKPPYLPIKVELSPNIQYPAAERGRRNMSAVQIAAPALAKTVTVRTIVTPEGPFI
jgi:hypothetical protein